MRNKVITVAIIVVVLLSAAVLLWYFSPSDVRIAGIEEPKELVIGQLSSLTIELQNNASKDVDVTVNVKNAFVDEKGVRLEGTICCVEENFSWLQLNTTEKPEKEIRLKPGINKIASEIGYQVPGPQKVEVEVYQQGKLADSKAIELNVLRPTIELFLQNYEGTNGTDEVHSVYGYLQLNGKGYASGIMVDISVINESTNTTVKTITRGYSLDEGLHQSEPLVIWDHTDSSYDRVTGARTTADIKTYSPIVVIELAKDAPSAEKYLRSPIVVKGKIGDRYRVVVTARWVDQVVTSEVSIPPNK